jgi:hypothetical protein
LALRSGNLKARSPSGVGTLLSRLGNAVQARGERAPIALTRLMEESERCLQAASTTAGPNGLAAARVLENPHSYRRWESGHVRLIGRIADQPHRPRQSATALSLAFSLVHGKSLFENLRDQNVRQQRRRALIAHFHGSSGYVHFMIQEYDSYLRSSASLTCLRHVGTELLQHAAFGEPLDEYEQTYAEYFRNYCLWAVPEHGASERDQLGPLLMQLKASVLIERKRLLALGADGQGVDQSLNRPY